MKLRQIATSLALSVLAACATQSPVEVSYSRTEGHNCKDVRVISTSELEDSGSVGGGRASSNNVYASAFLIPLIALNATTPRKSPYSVTVQYPSGRTSKFGLENVPYSLRKGRNVQVCDLDNGEKIIKPF